MTIAIIGATARRDKFSNKAVRAFLEHGEMVIPIHPIEQIVEGQNVFKSVLDVPQNIEIASFYVNAQVGHRVLEECAQRGITRVIFNPGASSDELVQRAQELKIEVLETCSIRWIGRAPSEFADE